MQRDLVIEWKHIGNDVTGTCDRCSRTGTTIREVLDDLRPFFRENRVVVHFRETVLPDSGIGESNQVVLNGLPLEDYLPGARVVQTPCCSCACITGKNEAECRAIEIGNERHEALPPALLTRVIIGLVEEMNSGNRACCSGWNCHPGSGG